METLEDWLRAGANTAHSEEPGSDVEDDANAAAGSRIFRPFSWSGRVGAAAYGTSEHTCRQTAASRMDLRW